MSANLFFNELLDPFLGPNPCRTVRGRYSSEFSEKFSKERINHFSDFFKKQGDKLKNIGQSFFKFDPFSSWSSAAQDTLYYSA